MSILNRRSYFRYRSFLDFSSFLRYRNFRHSNNFLRYLSFFCCNRFINYRSFFYCNNCITSRSNLNNRNYFRYRSFLDFSSPLSHRYRLFSTLHTDHVRILYYYSYGSVITFFYRTEFMTGPVLEPDLHIGFYIII